MNNSNNKWLYENPLLKNKDQRYYYDFGTGIEIEREEVKEERDAILNSATKTSNKPTNQKKDDFLEGFDDPYGEKREQERQRKEQERKERFAKIRENADNRTWSSQSATDPFLDGFNSVGIVKKREKEGVGFQKREPKLTPLPLAPVGEIKLQKLPGDPNKPLTLVQYANKETNDPWGPALSGDLNSNKDKELFLKGFTGENKQTQSAPQNPDAVEFGEDSETYKILQDLSKRWYATSDTAERDRLHKVAEEVRRLARGNNRVKYGTDEMFDVMHKNAKTGQLVKGLSLGTIPMQSVLTNPLLAGVSGSLLEPGAFLTAMTDYGPWDYKRKDAWHPTETYIDKNDRSRRYDGKNLDLDDQKNYIPWIYFDGYLIGADKFGNMNMAYVGKKMGLPEWVYKNFTKMDDPEDIFWIDKGTELAESGR